MKSITILGNSIAAHHTALALANSLSGDIEISLVKPANQAKSDILFGGVTGPEAYELHLLLGITEPELLLNTNSSFSWGTRYLDWTAKNVSWVQCFSLPFATDEGVDFQHLLSKFSLDLQDHLIGAKAGLAGTFAHPPSDKPQSPLSRAEYAYHFDYIQYNSLLANKLAASGVKIIEAEIDSLVFEGEVCQTIRLSSNDVLVTDFIIDARGQTREQENFAETSADAFKLQQQIKVSQEDSKQEKISGVLRTIQQEENGYTISIPLADKTSRMSVHTIEDVSQHDNDENVFSLGYKEQAWTGNFLAIGHSAYCLAPCSPAPFKLLNADINRLLELIPVNKDMQMESREYNRRYLNDIQHAELFNQALYDERCTIEDVEKGEAHASDLLERKVVQFLSRGTNVMYDLEPFTEQDWLILHCGMGRKPSRYDRLADQVDEKAVQAKLSAQKAGLTSLASQMPPHHVYHSKFLSYLKANK